jgi:hypothetical protein
MKGRKLAAFAALKKNIIVQLYLNVMRKGTQQKTSW